MPGTVGNDIRLGNRHIGRIERNAGIAVERMVLHLLEGVDEARATVGIDEMIAAVNRDSNSVCLLSSRKPEGNRQHDRIAVRHDRRLHGFLGIVPVRHLDIICQSRSGQMPADGGDVDDLMRHAEAPGAGTGEFQFLAMPLAVVEGDESDKLMFGCNLVGERNRVQSAGADDDSLHNV